jgi:hypothetical protein
VSEADYGWLVIGIRRREIKEDEEGIREFIRLTQRQSLNNKLLLE